MLLLALLLVALTTIADFIGAGIVVYGFYRPAIVRLIINFAVGTLLAVAILHLLPEALQLAPGQNILFFALVGIVLAFLFERFVAWYHCHDDKCETHPTSSGRKIVLLAGSSFEEFIDGATIGLALVASAAAQNPSLAILTTLAVFAHELPETASKVTTLAAFGVPAKRAMLLILATALAGFPGAAIAVLATEVSGAILPFLLALAAGIFIYIATADLIPELHRTLVPRYFLPEILAILLGIAVVLLLGYMG